MDTKITNPKRYVFYDIESTSAKADSTQIVQIAMIETDGDLNILLDKDNKELAHMFYIRMRQDMIPDPGAFLVHKVDPQWVGHATEAQDYINKPDGPIYSQQEAALIIRDILTKTPNTCIAGYNNDRFDDEILRHDFYRNMIDPYAHEWSNGNHRCDIFKAVQLCRMFAEKSLTWPIGDDEKVSMKLEKLSIANGLVHEKAHDALSDIYATIFLAKLIKERKPSLWNKFKMLSDKKHVSRLIGSGEVLSLTQTFIPKEQFGTSLVLPILQDKINKNKHYCIDITGDMSPLIKMSAEELRTFIFTPKSKRGKNLKDIDFSVRSVSINKTPLINMPPMKNEEESRNISIERICNRINKSIDDVLKNLDFVVSNMSAIRDKLNTVYSTPPVYDKKPVYTGLYDGFFTDTEKFNRDSLLMIDNNGARTLFSTDMFDFSASLPVSNEAKIKHLLLGVYAKWGAFEGKWSEIGNLSASDINELIIYQKFVSDNMTGIGQGIGIDSFKKKISQIKEQNSESPLTDFEKHIINNLHKEVNHTVKRYNELSALLTPALQRYAEKARTEDPNKYEFSYTLLPLNKKNEEIEIPDNDIVPH